MRACMLRAIFRARFLASLASWNCDSVLLARSKDWRVLFIAGVLESVLVVVFVAAPAPSASAEVLESIVSIVDAIVSAGSTLESCAE